MNSPETRNAVVLVIDRIGANMLGAYGNTWIETDNFNRLAARSLLFEQVISSSPKLDNAYQELWGPTEVQPDLLTTIGRSGASSVLLTDEPAIEHLQLAAGFDRVIPIQHPARQQLATKVEQTELASFFAQMTQWLTTMEPETLGWFHSRGLSGAWDAPFKFRQRLADADDPDPPRFCQPPATMFVAERDDPDELLGYQQACAAQILLMDDFLGAILELMDSDPIWRSTLFCLMSTRGYPLGEHQLVGAPEAFGQTVGSGDPDLTSTASEAQLYDESIHVPMLVCLPNRPEFMESQAVRNASLIQPRWISGFLSDWFSGATDSIDSRWRSISYSLPEPRQEAVCMLHDHVQSIQTRAWKLVRRRDRMELYVKPDDRWEVNDVSSRCPKIVSQLAGLLDHWIADGKVNLPADFELAEELAIRSD
jgi:hypothetical protein